MNEYMLIFRHMDGQKVASPEQLQIWMQQTIEWVNTMIEKNQFIGGNGLLFHDAKTVHHNGIVTNGPFGDVKETLGGYIMVKANSVDEAIEFAKASPILQGEGNTIEIRQISREDGIHEMQID